MDTELRAGAASAWAEERRFIESLTHEDRVAEGTHEAWSAKDLIAHVAAAKRRLVRAIDGELETLDHDEQAVYVQHAYEPWDQVEADAARAAADLAARLDRRVDAPWLGRRTLASFIAGYAIRHPLGHIADHWDARDERVEAEHVRVATESILATLPQEVAHPG